MGFLFVRSKAPRVKLFKQIHGGTQEFGLRAGTLANYQIFALATACREIFAKKEQNYDHVLRLRGLFLGEFKMLPRLAMQSAYSTLEGECCLHINTCLDNSYPGILSVSFPGIKAEALLAMLDGVCLSMGSACNSQAIEPSHVLVAIGLSADDANSTIRVSFGLMTTEQEVLDVAKLIKEKVGLLIAISPSKEGDYV